MINKAILLGFVGKDPEIRNLEGGLKVANFSLATTDKWKDKESGEERDATEWHHIVIWRGLAEVTEKYVKKGSQLYLEGKIKTRKWTDKDGKDHYTTEIFADILKILGKRETNGGERFEGQAKAITEELPPERLDDLSDLPF
jgi:single-strand DNA-binding protein